VSTPRQFCRWPTCLALALALWGFAGCTTPKGGGASNTSYMISSPKSEFYKYGPAQAFGPDLSLDRGQRVTMLQRQYGFSHVMLPDGTGGYVPTEDLAVAPPLPPTPKPVLISSANNANTKPSAHYTRRQSNVQPTGDPLFDINDVPSPTLPKDPEPAAKPTFRY
jgi:hypothetical protein